MTEDKKDRQVKTVYYISIGTSEYVATYNKAKALEFWQMLEDGFFRIAKVGSSYLYDSDLGKRRESSNFLYEAEISDSGITLKTLKVYMYPDEVSASKAQVAFNKMQEASKNKPVEQSPF